MRTSRAAAIILSCLFALSATASPTRAQDAGRVRAILENAVADPGDQAALQERLQEIDRQVERTPSLASAHYARGWILSRLGRNEESLAAYDRATQINPKLADAWYNAGIVLWDLGRDQEAMDRWRSALNADPGHADASYNLGQVSYNKRNFAAALDYWQRARTLAPENFNTVKKILQAQNALARWEDAVVMRQEVFRLHRESEDPDVRQLTEYCFDQFDVDRLHVFAYEIFEPSGPEPVLYAFHATRPDARTWGRVVVVGSGKDTGNRGPLRLDVNVGKDKVDDQVQLESLPDYPSLKEQVRSLVRKHILPVLPEEK